MYRWRFAQTPERIYNQGSAEILPDADVKDLGGVLMQKGYQVFRQGPSLYAFKGLAGRLGPIGVHASMLAIMAGVAIGGLGGFKGSVMVPTGGDFLVAQVSHTALLTLHQQNSSGCVGQRQVHSCQCIASLCCCEYAAAVTAAERQDVLLEP